MINPDSAPAEKAAVKPAAPAAAEPAAIQGPRSYALPKSAEYAALQLSPQHSLSKAAAPQAVTQGGPDENEFPEPPLATEETPGGPITLPTPKP